MKYKLKITTFLLGLLVLQLVTMGFNCKVKQTTVSGSTTVNCPAGQTGCGVSVTGITVVIDELTNNFWQQNKDISEGTYIIDLSNQWIPNAFEKPQVALKVMGSDGQFREQSFELQSIDNANVTAVNKQSTPYAFSFVNPSEVESFLNQSSFSDGSGERDFSMIYDFPVVQQSQSCVGSGDYTNHIRFKDSRGELTFITSPVLHYTATETPGSGICSGDITVSNN